MIPARRLHKNIRYILCAALFCSLRATVRTRLGFLLQSMISSRMKSYVVDVVVLLGKP